MPDWHQILEQTQSIQAQASLTAVSALDVVRRQHLHQLHECTSRNVIAYYSGWLSKPRGGAAEINDEDKIGFMTAVHGLDKTKGLDLLLHTPGGGIAATQSIVDYLHKMFANDIRAFVPQLAMSAGTMIACSCKEIWMGKQSNLGPIDPHMGGIPAAGVRKEFERAVREIRKDRVRREVWTPIIAQYTPTFLSRCEQAVTLSNSFVRTQLETVMFAGQPDAKRIAGKITAFLSNYVGNKSHDRHIHAEECMAKGLKIKLLEDDPTLQDLVLSVHHSYMVAFMNSSPIKFVENHLGRAFIKHVPMVPSPQSLRPNAEGPPS